MIAKDEVAVIRRALDSVRNLVDFVLVLDTGSSDGTKQAVEDWLQATGTEGTVLDETWVDFAYNRSLALAALRQAPEIDYTLVLDADDVLTMLSDGQVAEIKASLTADAYTLDIHHGHMIHQRVQLVSNKKPFFYRGIVHEFLDCRDNFTTAHLDGVAVRIIGGGTRSRSPDVYRADALNLEEALANSHQPDLEHRYTFYLAQSWRDCEESEKAIAVYLQRAEMGGWVEEVYVALLNAARLQERQQYALRTIIDTYRRAIAAVPLRVEAIHGLAKLLRLADLFHQSYEVAKSGIALAMPRGLFVEPWIYRWGLLDEYGVSAYWAGHPTESWVAAQLILSSNQLDQTTTARITENARFARQKCLE